MRTKYRERLLSIFAAAWNQHIAKRLVLSRQAGFALAAGIAILEETLASHPRVAHGLHLAVPKLALHAKAR
jgi:hypothetical protein